MDVGLLRSPMEHYGELWGTTSRAPPIPNAGAVVSKHAVKTQSSFHFRRARKFASSELCGALKKSHGGSGLLAQNYKKKDV